MFLFDVATPGREEEARAHFRDREDWGLFVRAEESADRATAQPWATIFGRTGDDCWRRSDEHHVLRPYDPSAVVHVLCRAGFDAEARGDYLPQPPPLPGWQVILGRRPG